MLYLQLEKQIKQLLTESEYIDFKTYIRVFSKTVFKAYSNEMDAEKIKNIMFLRREIFMDEPVDEEEAKELIDYFESIEDYETCLNIKRTKNEHNKNG